ncbi:MAG: rhomboid family intramembrane serine protease [Deltaproteobacteria bacterium]|nr:rhomboid family intramembrane serine protease [Deltaproteobacteria bacterium]
MIEIASYRAQSEAQAAAFTLQASGIEVRVDRRANGQAIFALLVAADAVDQARTILAEETRRSQQPQREPAPTAVPLYWVVGLLVVNICIWILTERFGGSTARATLLAFGAAQTAAFSAGQYWRMLTAVFLHNGLGHLLGNSVGLLLFGALAQNACGPGVFYAAYLSSGIFGNLVSNSFGSPSAVRVGASGAIFGALGIIAGKRIRQLRSGEQSRFSVWHVFAMLIAYYGFVVGASRQTDHAAHLGGLCAGLVWGIALPSTRPRARWQLIAGSSAALAFLGAFAIAIVDAI